MKITRLVFILVLLASVIFVPTKATSAFQAAPAGAIDVSIVGAPTFTNGQLTYHFMVTYSVEPTATADYDAQVIVQFQHPQVIDSFTVTNPGGQTVVTNVAAGRVSIPQVTMLVGSMPYVLEFDVTFLNVGSLPGSLPLDTSATATIANVDPLVGSLPVADTVEFTLGESGISVVLTANPTLVQVNGTVTYTVQVSTTEVTVLPVHARVSVQFAQADLAAGVIGELNAQAPVVVDNVNKVVTWDGMLAPAGTLPVTFTFTVKAGSLPGGVTTTYTATATATASDFNVPGSLPTVTDSETFTIEAMDIYLPLMYRSVP